MTAGAIDGGEKPSVPSAMLKYHVTEMGRQVANDAMDVHGGKGIMLGPRNYLGRGYQVGAGRDHGRGREHPDAQPHHLRPGRDPLPSVRAASEMNAARNPDRDSGVDEFDRALFGHIGFTISQRGALASSWR